MRVVFPRGIAWFSIAALALASWLPGDEMIRTGANGRLEHAAAYLVSGFAVLTAYHQKPKWLLATLMTCYAGVLELGQLLVPGRHPAVLDWLASSSGVFCAVVMVVAHDAYHRTASPG
jgi:VanZ family protein